MATDHLQIPDIQANQNQPEVTANAAHNLGDRAMNQYVSKAISGSTSFSTTETRENTIIELTGTPGSAFNVDMPDGNERKLNVLNSTDAVATIRNSASGGADQPVVPVGGIVTFHYDGTDFIHLRRERRHMQLSLGTLREIASNDIDTLANHGGILTSDSTPTYARVNGATDKALRVTWVAGNVDEVQFPPVAMPPDLDAAFDVVVHLVARMAGATDTPTIDVQAFDGIGDTEMGGVTQALSNTLQELTVTLANADISGNPLGFLNLSLIPGTHGTDALELYSAWLEYTTQPS